MSISACVVPSSVRIFQKTPVLSRRKTFTLETALNERSSFQVAVRNAGAVQHACVRLEAAAPAGLDMRVRRVGYVPLPHLNTPVEADDADLEGRDYLPGFVPDPLFDECEVTIPPLETHAFWVTVTPNRKARPGRHTIELTISPVFGDTVTLSADVVLHDIRLAKRRGFPITHWFYADALLDWYQLEPFEKAFWPIAERYLRNYTGHGLDTVYLPLFTPPLDGDKRPTQLLRVKRRGPHSYSFDWRDVKKWVDLARKCGVQRFECVHLFRQWGVKLAPNIYEGQGQGEKLLWKPDTGAVSKTYRLFLSQLLPRLERFLKEEGILKKTFFHVSDEPHGDEHIENYQKARALLAELAPWMKVMDALTDIRFGSEGLTDMPVPSITTALDFHEAGIPSWCYYCCGPRGKYLNRLLDTPLAKIAMHGLLFYRWPFKGFLHWGYNYWNLSQTRTLIDPFTVSDGGAYGRGWAYGDPFVVYPGPDGPIDSIRWEVFAESLQDYALAQTVGLDRDDPRLAALKSFEDFPKNAEWRTRLRKELLTR